MGKGRNRKSMIIFHNIEPPSVKENEYQRVSGNDDIAIIYRNVTIFNYAINCNLAHSLSALQ